MSESLRLVLRTTWYRDAGAVAPCVELLSRASITNASRIEDKAARRPLTILLTGLFGSTEVSLRLDADIGMEKSQSM